MSGTYIGTYHGGNDFAGKDQSFADIFAVHDALQAQAVNNVVAAWGGLPPELANLPYSSGGPGVPSVGGAGPVTSGPGVRVTASAGSGHVSGAGSGPGNRVVKVGGVASPGVLNFGGKVLPLSPESKNTVTEITVFGGNVHANRGFSDANQFEQRYGDSEILSTLYGGAVIAADGLNTAWDAAGWLTDQVMPKEIQEKNLNEFLPDDLAIDWLGNGQLVTGNVGGKWRNW